jgi:hypothetical protein
MRKLFIKINRAVNHANRQRQRLVLQFFAFADSENSKFELGWEMWREAKNA